MMGKTWDIYECEGGHKIAVEILEAEKYPERDIVVACPVCRNIAHSNGYVLGWRELEKAQKEGSS